MLTDYHTHLRPDDPQATAERSFTEENVARYLGAAKERGIGDLGVAEHVHRFRQALDAWRHPFWVENATDDLDAYCDLIDRMKAAGQPVKLGLELDWIAGREAELGALIDEREFDYVIGSVHFIAGDAVDHEDYDIWRGRSAEDVWARYFTTLGEAAGSGLYDILAHPDLVKIWGADHPPPGGDLRRYYELAMPGIEAVDIAIEVSTAGLRKPVAEIYPAREFLEMCLDLGKPVSLSSDAHIPEEIGYAYPEALDYLRSAGVDRVATFERRERREVELS